MTKLLMCNECKDVVAMRRFDADLSKAVHCRCGKCIGFFMPDNWHAMMIGPASCLGIHNGHLDEVASGQTDAEMGYHFVGCWMIPNGDRIIRAVDQGDGFYQLSHRCFRDGTCSMNWVAQQVLDGFNFKLTLDRSKTNEHRRDETVGGRGGEERAGDQQSPAATNGDDPGPGSTLPIGGGLFQRAERDRQADPVGAGGGAGGHPGSIDFSFGWASNQVPERPASADPGSIPPGVLAHTIYPIRPGIGGDQESPGSEGPQSGGRVEARGKAQGRREEVEVTGQTIIPKEKSNGKV